MNTAQLVTGAAILAAFAAACWHHSRADGRRWRDATYQAHLRIYGCPPPPELPRYRIRWARVEGNSGRRQWACIAEQMVTLPFGFTFWWPLRDAEWRHSEPQAQYDIDHDIEMRLPPSASRRGGSLADSPSRPSKR